MHREAAERGHLPPDRSGLRERVFRAVARDRVDREPVPRRTTLPLLHPGVALVAAAALILVVIGVRYLGDTRWKGRLDTDRGARLLVTRDAFSFETVTGPARDIGPGEMVLVLPGQTGRIVLPDGSSIKLSAPALVALDTHMDKPRVLIGRGFVRIESQGGKPVAVAAGGRMFTVEGIAEFNVREPSRHRAFDWAATEIARDIRAAILGTARAGAGGSRALVTAHALGGRVRTRSPVGAVIHSGEAGTFGPGSRGTKPFRIGGRSILEPISDVFTTAETNALGRLLAETGGDRARLIQIASDSTRTTLERQLAVWLIGEMGVSSAAPDLEAVLEAATPVPTAVRSATVAALTKIAADRGPWLYVNDPEPAVAEAALLGCARMRLGDPRKELLDVLQDREQADDLRVLAAARLRAAKHRFRASDLTEFLASEDRSAAALAVDVLVSLPDGPASLAGSLEVVDPWLVPRILNRLAGTSVTWATAEALARSALDETIGDTAAAAQERFRAALNYLGSRRAEGLSDAIVWGLSEGAVATKLQALESLGWALSRGRIDDLGKDLRALVLLRVLPVDVRLQALRLLRADTALLGRLVEDPSPEISAEACSQLLGVDETGARRDLALATLSHVRDEAREAAWIWLGRHDPEEALRHGAQWVESSAHAVVIGLEVAQPGLTDLNSRDAAARILGRILERPADRADTEDKVVAVIGALAKAGSPVARRICRDLAVAEDRPADLRLGAAQTLASYARSGPDVAAIEKILADSEVDLAESVAQSVTSGGPPADLIRRLRKAGLAPRVRARLALCRPFDADYALGVLRTGDSRAITILLGRLHAEEAAQVREGLRECLSDPKAANRFLALRHLALGEGPVELPTRLLGDPDPWVHVAALAARVAHRKTVERSTIERAVRVVRGDHSEGLTAALEGFAATATVESASSLLKKMKGAPPARSALPALRTPPGHRTTVRTTRRENRELDLKRLEPGPPASMRELAARSLARTGGRADLQLLFDVAGDDESEAGLRRAALCSAGALLARWVDVAEPGPALGRIEGWWRDRSFALEVPVLPRDRE